MKKLVALGLLAATVAFAGTAFADGGILQDQELQKLFAWSTQAPQSAGPVPAFAERDGLKEQGARARMRWSIQAMEAAKAANQPTQTAGLQATKPLPPYQVYPGYRSN